MKSNRSGDEVNIIAVICSIDVALKSEAGIKHIAEINS